MNANQQITELTPADYQQACLIETRSNPHPWSSSSLCETISHYQSLAYWQQQQLLGFVLFQTVLDETEIIHIVCEQSQQRRGIASSLLMALFAKLPTGDKVLLEVRDSNHAAKQLYQQLGFMVSGRRKNYYRNQEDALIMQKE